MLKIQQQQQEKKKEDEKEKERRPVVNGNNTPLNGQVSCSPTKSSVSLFYFAQPYTVLTSSSCMG